MGLNVAHFIGAEKAKMASDPLSSNFLHVVQTGCGHCAVLQATPFTFLQTNCKLIAQYFYCMIIVIWCIKKEIDLEACISEFKNLLYIVGKLRFSAFQRDT